MFTDPVKHQVWQVFVEKDADGNPHAVFAQDTVRLHPAETLTVLNDLSSDRLQQLFLTSYRELSYDNEVWRVRWEEREEKVATWTWFESASGQKLLVQGQIMFPFMSEPELADELRKAQQHSA